VEDEIKRDRLLIKEICDVLEELREAKGERGMGERNKRIRMIERRLWKVINMLMGLE
jgi:hypothetical protein